MTVYLPLHCNSLVEISDDDVDLADHKHYHWYIHGNGFVCCTVGRTPERHMLILHRIIYERIPGHDPLKPRQQIEHIDGNLLNNQRENLRLRKREKRPPGSLPRNNTSGYLGVSRYGLRKRAFIREYKGKNIYLGTYDMPEVAARAYQEAKERKARGEKIRNY